MTSIFFVWSFI